MPEFYQTNPRMATQKLDKILSRQTVRFDNVKTNPVSKPLNGGANPQGFTQV